MKSTDKLPFQYLVNSGALTNASNGQVTLTMQADSWFELNIIAGSCTEDTDTDFMPNNFSVQITDQGTGRQLSNARIPERILTPYHGYRLTTPIEFPPSTILLFDFLNLTANTNTISVVLQGYKNFKL